jgi:hypothetical protein
LTAIAGGLDLALILLRVQLRSLYNSGWRKAPTGRRIRSLVFLGLAAGVLLFAVWLPEILLAEIAPRALLDLGAKELGSWLAVGFLGYTVVLLYGGLTFTLSSMLLSRDLDLLMVTSRPVSAVLSARVWSRSASLLVIGALAAGPLLVLVPLRLNQPAAIPVTLLVLAAYPVLPIVLVSVAVLAVIRFIPAHRAREIIAILGLAIAFGTQIANVMLNPAYAPGEHGRVGGRGFFAGLAQSPLASAGWLPWTWPAHAMALAVGGDPVTALAEALLLAATALLAVLAGTRLMSALYLSGWAQGTTGGHRHRAPSRPRTGLATGWFGIDPVVMTVVIKDWRIRRRDIVMLVRTLLPMVFIVLLLYRNSVGSARLWGALGNGALPALLSLAPVLAVLFGPVLSIALTAMSLEGQAVWIYAVSPNSLRRLVVAKALSVAAPAALLAASTAIVFEVLGHVASPWSIGAVLLAGVLGASWATIAACVGAMLPRFDWTDARHMASGGAGLLAFLVLVGMALVVALVTAGPVVAARLAHFSENAAFVGGVATAIVLSAIMVGIVVPIATARLSQTELGKGANDPSAG